jgi:uncharacterized glyoxalase superfamily protein PhnB
MAEVRYEGIFPGLKYKDAPAAIEWLERAFGFKPDLVVRDEDGTIGHSQLWAGDYCISVSTAGESDALRRITPQQAGGVTQLLYFVVDDVDAHYQRAIAAGAEIVYPLTEQDYGGKDYGCRDPEGHAWSFGTYRPTREGG